MEQFSKWKLQTSGGSDGNMTIEVFLHSSRNMHAREMFISVFAQYSHFSLLLYSYLWFFFNYIYFVFYNYLYSKMLHSACLSILLSMPFIPLIVYKILKNNSNTNKNKLSHYLIPMFHNIVDMSIIFSFFF